VSASPSPASTATASVIVLYNGHGTSSAAGMISSVIATPGITTATARSVIARRLPPSPTAARAAASVRVAAASTSLGLPVQRSNQPRSAAVSAVPVHGLSTHRYGPSSAAATAGAITRIASPAGTALAAITPAPKPPGRRTARQLGSGIRVRSGRQPVVGAHSGAGRSVRTRSSSAITPMSAAAAA
jgi:hypothetical protein